MVGRLPGSGPAGHWAWDESHLRQLREHPHLLGHLLGKTKLKQMHSDWIRQVWETPIHNTLQAHRGAYKTTAITEVGCIWWLLFHPNDRIALVRKPYTEAARTLKAITRYFKTEVIQSLFGYAHGVIPVAVTRQENTVTFNFKTTITKEGNLDAFGTDSALTGSHYDKIICDDVITLRDRISSAERRKTAEALHEILANVIDPGKQVMVIGTPWHPDDAWKLLPEGPKFDVATTGLLSDAQIEERRRLTTPSLFAANYELKHIAASDRIFPEFAQVQSRWKTLPHAVAHLDAAFGGGHYTALTIMGKMPDGTIQAEGWAWQSDVKNVLSLVAEAMTTRGVKEFFAETNPDKGYTLELVRSATSGSIRCTGYAETTNKHVKIVTHLLGAWPSIMWVERPTDSSWNDYAQQVLDYVEGQEPDDAPDSAASLIRQAFNQGSGIDRALWTM